eukprot:1339815-Amorphochlora_amoeboformis.AAC.2
MCTTLAQIFDAVSQAAKRCGAGVSLAHILIVKDNSAEPVEATVLPMPSRLSLLKPKMKGGSESKSKLKSKSPESRPSNLPDKTQEQQYMCVSMVA